MDAVPSTAVFPNFDRDDDDDENTSLDGGLVAPLYIENDYLEIRSWKRVHDGPSSKGYAFLHVFASYEMKPLHW